MIDPTGAPPTAKPAEGKDPSPENKQMYDLIVANVRGFVSDEANADRILSAIQSGDPAEMVGRQAGMLMSQVVESAAENGQTPSTEVAVAASAATISEIIELAVAAGAIDPSAAEDKEFLASAMKSLRESVGVEEPNAEGAQEPVEQAPQPAQAQQPGPRGMLGAAREGMMN